MNFFDWMITTFLEADNPQGDLARDMAHDHYQGPNRHSAIRSHLQNQGACQACLEVFDDCWEEYQHHATALNTDPIKQ